MDDDDLPLLVLSVGGAFAAVALIGRALDTGDDDARAPAQPAPTIDPGAWVFPVPDLAARRPEISDTFAAEKTDAHRQHLGVDIMFRRQRRGELVDVYPPGAPNGSLGYFMPDDVPVMAAGAGVVVFAGWTRRGYTVKVRHREGVTTYYTHLATVSATTGQTIAAGQTIGTVGYDPTDRRRLKHLHFELWRGTERSGAIDPRPYLLAWKRRAIASWTPPSLRNRATLTYRPVGWPSERYPEWVRALKGKAGVYVVRERKDDGGGGRVLYVGQSGSDLYATMTRHFQTWRRAKRWWSGQFSRHDPGLTYARGSVDVAVRVTSPADAIDEEVRLIRRLRPVDNVIGQPEDVPF